MLSLKVGSNYKDRRDVTQREKRQGQKKRKKNEVYLIKFRSSPEMRQDYLHNILVYFKKKMWGLLNY